jgi:hypothetical protein
VGKCSVGGAARGFFPLVECATPAVHSLWETVSIVPTKQAVRQSTENSNALCIRVNTRLAVEAGCAPHKSIKNEKQSDSYVCLFAQPAMSTRASLPGRPTSYALLCLCRPPCPAWTTPLRVPTAPAWAGPLLLPFETTIRSLLQGSRP